MRPEQEPPRAIPRPVADLDAEREVDFGRLMRTVLARWWLVAAAVAVGAVVGYLTSLGGGDVFQAKTTLYLGQPLSPTGGSQIVSLATNPATVNEIVRSEAVIQDVARRIGVPPGRLRRGISTRAAPITDAARRTTTNPLVDITVRGPWGRRTAQAASLLAAAVVDETSQYVDVKVRSLNEQLASENKQIAAIDRELDALQESAQRSGNLSSAERLILVSLISVAEQRRGQLLDERTDTQQLLTAAETVERSAPITEPRAVKVPAQSPRSSIIVGAVIGLLVGGALALVWEPLVGRRRLRAP